MAKSVQRVVLAHLTGHYAGINQIVGTTTDLQRHFRVAGLPKFCPGVEFIDHRGDCELVAERERYVLY